jgi:hypothetical protein
MRCESGTPRRGARRPGIRRRPGPALRLVPEFLPLVKNPFSGPMIPGINRNMKFEFERFYQAVNAKRTQRAASWRQVAREIGIGKSTLARMAQNKRPDADGLAALSFWAQLNPADFVSIEPVAPLAHRNSTEDRSPAVNGAVPA